MTSFYFLYCKLWTYLTPCFNVSIVNFEQVFAMTFLGRNWQENTWVRGFFDKVASNKGVFLLILWNF